MRTTYTVAAVLAFSLAATAQTESRKIENTGPTQKLWKNEATGIGG